MTAEMQDDDEDRRYPGGLDEDETPELYLPVDVDVESEEDDEPLPVAARDPLDRPRGVHNKVRTRVEVQNHRDIRGGELTPREWLALREAFLWCCAYCGRRRRLQIEHVVPVSAGGRTLTGNILPACKACNWSKRARALEKWQPLTEWWIEFLGRLVAATERYEAGAKKARSPHT